MTFNRLAPFYRAMEVIAAGGKLQRCRVRFLREIATPRKILIAGEGHGRFLPSCVRMFPEAQILVVDISEKMLKIARSKVDSDRVKFICADFLEWNGPPGKFDLIVTNFFLDCFTEEELKVVVSKLGKLATPRADWLVADFEIAPKGWARLRSQVIVAMLYRFFRIVCELKAQSLADPHGEMANAGFSLRRRETQEWGLLKSEWWQRGSDHEE